VGSALVQCKSVMPPACPEADSDIAIKLKRSPPAAFAKKIFFRDNFAKFFSRPDFGFFPRLIFVPNLAREIFSQPMAAQRGARFSAAADVLGSIGLIQTDRLPSSSLETFKIK
jgi:hypothetical protein